MSEPTGVLEQLTAAINRLADAYTNSPVQKSSVSKDAVVEKVANVVDASTADTGTVDASTTGKKTTTNTRKNTTKKADDTAKSERTKQEVLDSVVAVRDALGAPAARELLARHGFPKLSQVDDPSRFDALYDDAVSTLADSSQPEVIDDEI